MKHQNQSHTSSAGQASFLFSSPLLGTQHPYPSPACTWPRSTSKRPSVKIPHQKIPSVFLQGRRGSGQLPRRGRGFNDNSRRSETAASRSCTRCGSGLTRLREPSRSAGPGGNARSRRRPRQSHFGCQSQEVRARNRARRSKRKNVYYELEFLPQPFQNVRRGRSVRCASSCLLR